LTFQQGRLLEKESHEISEDDLNRYFNAVATQLQNVPSLLLWNIDETRVRISKKHVAPDVIVAKQTPP
jgi:hypothetical protein